MLLKTATLVGVIQVLGCCEVTQLKCAKAQINSRQFIPVTRRFGNSFLRIDNAVLSAASALPG
jgi:hypothetical protein